MDTESLGRVVFDVVWFLLRNKSHEQVLNSIMEIADAYHHNHSPGNFFASEHKPSELLQRASTALARKDRSATAKAFADIMYYQKKAFGR